MRLTLLPLLVVLSACASGPPDEIVPAIPAGRPAPPRAAQDAAEAEAARAAELARRAAIPDEISDTDWTLTTLNGQLVGRVMEVDLSGGQIDGMGPCHSIRGNYYGTGPIFVVETIIVPRLPDCERAALQEQIAIAMIDARSALIEDGRLVVRDAEGNVRLEFLPLG
ncbi:hypothetical protein [Roseobacter sp. HKCCA0434]|uniref:hypothetical protein n=1 Tax=Roseobacter sp. HKCCA0434 TaxID=3079297 RepID=UPI002905C42C|nr:hypothetical protein [Roseobacter sp. HKCCA0434]